MLLESLPCWHDRCVLQLLRKPVAINYGETRVSQPPTEPYEKLTMVNLITMCRNIATVFVLSFAMFSQTQNVVAQEFLDSYSTLRSPSLDQFQVGQSVLDSPDLIADLNVPEDLNVLTRGPMHEAFASVHQADPQPSALVFKTPPEVIDEVPPEYKPDGNNVQWISGYWAWDDAQSDFIWISGIWRDVPPNRNWIPGYWDAEGNGFHWISGVWAEETQVQLGYLPQPPASIDQGPSTTAPGEEYFYVPGNWTHQDGDYRWLTGHWQPLIENWIWIPSRYVWTPNGCVYLSGYWDYEIQNRGTCFAPVQFTRPVYLANNYSYCPSYAINLSVDFLTHLFVRPDCGHYFYGDWYASNFNNVRYQPWVSYSSHYRNYDPLLAYYGHRRSSLDRRYNVVQYLTQQHNFYVNNRDYRPRPTYRSQYEHAKRNKHFHASGRSDSRGPRKPHEDYIRKSSYVGNYKDFRANDDRRRGQTDDARNRGSHQFKSKKHYHKVADKELRDTRRNVEQLAKMQRDRKRQEHSGKQYVARKPSGKKYLHNNASVLQRAQDQSRQSRERARNASAEAERRQRQVAELTLSKPFRKPTSTNRIADRRTDELSGRTHDEIIRRTQEQARRIQQQRQRERSSASRNTSGRIGKPNSSSKQQIEQAARKVKQELARKATQQSQRDAARRSQQKTQQDLARRSQQEQARRDQDQARRTQQKSQEDQARRKQQKSQEDQARRAKQQKRRTQQDQARRAREKSQQDQARRAKQDRDRRNQKAAADRAKQEQARRAQQEKSKQDQARRVNQQRDRRNQKAGSGSIGQNRIKTRRNQQAAATRAKQDQARRAQQQKSKQDQARRAKQDQDRRNQQAAANSGKARPSAPCPRKIQARSRTSQPASCSQSSKARPGSPCPRKIKARPNASCPAKSPTGTFKAASRSTCQTETSGSTRFGEKSSTKISARRC